jgi:hypothetical protein
MTLGKPLAMLLAVVLGGCHAKSGREPAHPPPVPLSLAFSPPSSCIVSVASTAFSLPAQEKPLLAALRRQASTSSNAILAGGPEIPFKCVGYAVYVAQRAGFARVAFAADPPPVPQK